MFSRGITDSATARKPSGRLWWVGPPLLLVVALYILPIAGSPAATNPNEVVRIELAVTIAFWAQLAIGPAAEIYGLSEDVSIHESEIYSDKAPWLSIVSTPIVWIVDPMLPREPSSDLPAYWPLRHVLTAILIALPTVGLAFLVGSMVPGCDPRRRTAVAMIAALATPLWTYGTVFFGHAPAALLITLGWLLLLGVPGRTTALDARWAGLGGVAVGFAVATEYPTILLAAVIYASLLMRRTAPKILASAVAGAALGALPAMIYHQVAFGAPWLTGYSFKAAADFQAILEHGVFGVSWPSAETLWGILFGARRGIFYYSPILALAPIGLRGLVRRYGWRDAGPILVATLGYVFFASSFVDWPAGWCAAARHLVPIIPILTVIASFAAVRLVRQFWGAVTVVILIAASGTNTWLTIALTPFFPPQFGAPLAELVLPSLSDGAASANLLSSVSGVASVWVVVFAGVVVNGALIWASIRLIGDRRWWPAAVATATSVVLLSVFAWQGSAPRAETELMRAQMLRRLNHFEVADRIEEAIVSAGAR